MVERFVYCRHSACPETADCLPHLVWSRSAAIREDAATHVLSRMRQQQLALANPIHVEVAIPERQGRLPRRESRAPIPLIGYRRTALRAQEFSRRFQKT